MLFIIFCIKLSLKKLILLVYQPYKQKNFLIYIKNIFFLFVFSFGTLFFIALNSYSDCHFSFATKFAIICIETVSRNSRVASFEFLINKHFLIGILLMLIESQSCLGPTHSISVQKFIEKCQRQVEVCNMKCLKCYL